MSNVDQHGTVGDASPRGTVLFVDDEENILAALKRLFRNSGCRLLTASSGPEGLDVMVKESVDLVVSDMRMPQMDGAQFLKLVAEKWPDTIRVLLTGYSDLGSTVNAINDGQIYRYISKPWEDTDIKLTVQQALEQRFLRKEKLRLEELTRRQNQDLADLNAGLERKVKARTAELEQMMGMLDTAHEELKQHYAITIKVFSNLVEMREGHYAGHARRVADVARRLAKKLDLDKSAIKDVIFGSLLHDIGQMSLSDELLNTPFNNLSQKDRAKFMTHPALGESVLMALEPLHGAAALIAAHHESFDGSGFPKRLQAEAIPLGARIIAVADDYDALQMGAITPKRLTAREARDYIVQQRGKRYDPGVVDSFTVVIDDMIREENEEPAILVKVVDLKPGMVLARDLVTDDGMLLLAKGHAFDGRLIQKVGAVAATLEKALKIFVKPTDPSTQKTASRPSSAVTTG